MLLLTSLVIAVFSVFKYKENLLTKVFVETKKFVDVYDRFEEGAAKRERFLVTSNRKFNGSAGVYVLVIGESHNKNHMSAYGYGRRTTPWLDRVKNKKNVAIFQNIYACHVNTVPVLTYALSQKNQYNGVQLQDALTIVEACKAVGFDVVWLSNQVKYGIWDSPITSIALRSNEKIWINFNIGGTTETNFYDGELVRYLDSLRIGENTLIVIHLMGSHAGYEKRYPKDFCVFKGKSAIDHYDNSVLYNDHVMECLYEKCRQLPNFQALVYVADHADDIDKGLCHDSSQFTMSMAEIPMYVIVSDGFGKNNLERLISAKYRFMTNDLLFNFMLSFMGIRIDEIYEPYNDFFSEEYNGKIGRFRTLHGKEKLSVVSK